MPSRKLLKSVLRGFLGTFVSRYSDLDGYLLFGVATVSLDGLEVDLTGEGPPPSLDPVNEFRRLAIRRFTEQLAKAHLPRSVVSGAHLAVRRDAGPPHEHAGPGQGVLLGHHYTFTVGVVTDLGRPYRAECREFIAPHAPELFARSTRRGNTDSAGDDA